MNGRNYSILLLTYLHGLGTTPAPRQLTLTNLKLWVLATTYLRSTCVEKVKVGVVGEVHTTERNLKTQHSTPHTAHSLWGNTFKQWESTCSKYASALCQRCLHSGCGCAAKTLLQFGPGKEGGRVRSGAAARHQDAAQHPNSTVVRLPAVEHYLAVIGCAVTPALSFR
jgi:hypothetical protein